MRICRFDNDRLGIVSDGLVHDVTDIQEQIRATAPYTLKGDAVIKSLPEWRDRLTAEAAKVRGIPISDVKLLSPVARPSKALAAPTNYADHIAEMAPGRAASGVEAHGQDRHGWHFPQGSVIHRRAIGGCSGAFSRAPDRS